MGGKVVIIENGVAKTPIPLPKEIFHCAMYDDGTSCYESSGISEQEIEDAISAGKLVVCSFVTMHSGDILTTELIASSVLGPYPVFTGTCRTPSGLLAIKVTYDKENSTAQQEWWSVERTYIPSGNTITIDTELSETSTNPVQNKAINVLTRKLWDKVDIVSRLDNEYVRHDFYIVSQTNNKWGGSSTSNYKHWIVPVSNMREVIITSNANTQQAYSFFKSYSTPVSGDTPDYATGYDGIKAVSAGETLRVTVPPDAEYLYINTGNAGAAKAAHIYMTGIGITDEFELPSLDNNAGKVLAVNNSATGVEWVNQSDTEDVFVCTYNSTNNTMSKQPQAIAAAHNNGKVIICKFNNGIYYCNIVSDSMIVFSLLKAGIAYNGSGTEVIGITEPTAQYIVYSHTTNTWNVSTPKILQEKLISGSNIKTINGNSLLGSGNLTISGGNVNVQSDWNQTDSTADDFIKNKPTIPTLPTIDTSLSETSTNPVQNKAINVLTRKLWQEVDIVSRLGSEYPAANKQISSGSWSSSFGSAYKHWAIPVDGMRTVSVTANSSQYAILTFLKTYNSTTGTPDFATGYTENTTVNADQTRILNVPSDANWLIVMTGNNGVRKPDHIYLTGVAANYPQLTYVQLASGATTCDISLTDTKQSFVIDNSANTSSIPITVTNQFNDIYSDRNIGINQNLVVQFDFESVESEQKTYLFVKQTVMYDRTV